VRLNPSILYSRIMLAAALFLWGPSHIVAQGVNPAAAGNTSAVQATPTAPPAAALRDLLSAACAQNQKDFLRFLTARNKEAFARLTPAARVALMKRFVLLGEPGKPTSTTNTSGRPTVSCQTPAVTTDMQIGGADVRDNIAFLPLELRDSQDSTGDTVHQATIGLVREDGEWKLLSLGLLFLDLPALEVEWDAAEMDSNESTAIESLKKISAAIQTYLHTYARLPQSLANLGPPLHGAPTADSAGLVDSDLATEAKNGYTFRYVIVGGTAVGAEAKYEIAAKPASYARTGQRSFLRDSSGGLHGADHHGGIATPADPRVE
jgi:hypothetical protein